jgi:hypothetical protein
MSENEYDTTDKNITLLLFTAGLPLIRSSKDEHQKTVFFFDRKTAKEWIDRYQKSEPMKFEYSDFLRALGLFNSIVHSR